jgi:uncharacterized protein (PEP-CTERM system associated)
VVRLRVPRNSARKVRGGAKTCCLGAACTVIALLVPEAGLTDEWQIKPAVSAFESFTSNARLDPPGDERPDFVTTVSPSLDVHRDSPRLKFDMNYALNAIVYARETNLSEVQHQLNFSSRGVVVPEMIFIDASAAIAQQPKESERPTSGSSLIAAQNSESIYTYRISPSINNHLGTFADSGLKYTFGQVYSNGLSNTTVQSVDGSLISGSRFTRFIWALNSSGLFSTGSRDITNIFAAASAEYPINRTISLFGSAGYERISDSTLDDQPNGPIGTAGVRLSGVRSNMEVLYNHRYDSDFVTGDASYVIDPQSRITAGYTERVETSQLIFVNNLGFLQRDQFGNFIDSRTERLFHLGDANFGLEDNAFRFRAFNLALHILRGRNTWDAVAYHERRDTDETDEHDTATGGSVTWAHRLDELTTLDLTARYRYETFDDESNIDHTQLIGAGATLVENLNENLDAVFAVNLTKQLADTEDDRFVETVVSMGLIKRF